MDKKSVFFSLHSVSPKTSSPRRFYYKSNKSNSTNLLNYIIDAHSFDDVGSTPFTLLNVHDNTIYDSKQGYVDFEKVKPSHKHSYIFSGIVSFDENLSNQDIFKLHWEDISNIIYNTLIESNDFDRNEWEMQSNMHFNTPNKHIQFRFYQNKDTKPENLYNRYYIPKKCLQLIKNRVFNFVASKQNDSVRNYPHVLKHVAMKGYNNRVRENRNLIQDFLDVIKSKNIDDKNTKKVLLNIGEIYFKRTIFNKWLTSITTELNLNKEEHDAIKSIVINNINDGLFNFIMLNRNQKVFDFISKPDPHQEPNKKQKFKNYDKINKQTDFEKLTTYSPVLIKKVYKEPMSRFIDYVLKANHCNIPEAESAISNYINVIRPDFKDKVEITKVRQVQQSQNINQMIDICIKSYDKTQMAKCFIPTAVEWYKKNWLSSFFAKWYKDNKINPNVQKQINNEIIKRISANMNWQIGLLLSKSPKPSSQDIIKEILTKDQFSINLLEESIIKILEKNNLSNLTDNFYILKHNIKTQK